MTAALIEADGIGLVLDGKTVLHDVSLKLEPNRLVTLIGPNGAGKSSLVGVLLGLRCATGGRGTGSSASSGTPRGPGRATRW